MNRQRTCCEKRSRPELALASTAGLASLTIEEMGTRAGVEKRIAARHWMR